MAIQDIIKEREGSTEERDFQITGLRTRAKMITFIKRDGVRYSFNYAYLHGVWAVDERIRIDFTRCLVIVRGRGMWGIQKALTDHRVIFIRESELGCGARDESASIEKITVSFFRGGGGDCGGAQQTELQADGRRRMRLSVSTALVTGRAAVKRREENGGWHPNYALNNDEATVTI